MSATATRPPETPFRDGVREKAIEDLMRDVSRRNPAPGEIVVTFDRITNRCTVVLDETHLDELLNISIEDHSHEGGTCSCERCPHCDGVLDS